MSPEPGWYHFEGDAEGTMRAWDGQQWVGEPQVITHQPLRPSARLVTILFRGLAIIQALHAIVRLRDVDRFRYFEQHGESRPQDVATARRTSRHVNQLGEIETLVWVAGAVLFLVWFHRAYSNLRSLRGSSYFTPGWAIGAWFVPIINLYRPLNMMQELRPFTTSSERDRRLRMLIISWWVTFLAADIVDLILRYVWTGGLGPLLWTYSQIVNRLAYLVAAVLAIRVVQAVTEYQDGRLIHSTTSL